MKTFSKPPRENTYRPVVCPVCGDEEILPKWSLPGYSFSRCKTCGLLYQNPQPLETELLRRYDSEYFDYELENEEAYFQLMLLGLRDAGFFSEIEKTGRENGSFLDIGCATGKLLHYLKSRGWNEQGVEVCAPAAEYAREVRGVNVLTGTLEQAMLPEERYDLIHASHLIEHLTEPRGFVRQLYRLLKPGGYLLLATPNSDGFQARFFGAKWRSAIADHMFLFSKKTLSRLLRREGFHVERISTWGGLAAGLAPMPVKGVLDRLAKATGTGDVMILRARKPS